MKLPVLTSTLAVLILLGPIAPGQIADTAATDAIRVNITVNPDGSRTAYQFDPAQHKATATTTTAEGKPGEKIQYKLDDAGRFARGRIFGPDGQIPLPQRLQIRRGRKARGGKSVRQRRPPQE